MPLTVEGCKDGGIWPDDRSRRHLVVLLGSEGREWHCSEVLFTSDHLLQVKRAHGVHCVLAQPLGQRQDNLQHGLQLRLHASCVIPGDMRKLCRHPVGAMQGLFPSCVRRISWLLVHAYRLASGELASAAPVGLPGAPQRLFVQYASLGFSAA